MPAVASITAVRTPALLAEAAALSGVVSADAHGAWTECTIFLRQGFGCALMCRDVTACELCCMAGVSPTLPNAYQSL